MDYMRCPVSLSGFMNAVLSSRIPHTTLSADLNTSESIENQQIANINASADKDQKKSQYSVTTSNRNRKREGAARQPKSIPLLNWGPLFQCHSKRCAYQNCDLCGIKNFLAIQICVKRKEIRKLSCLLESMRMYREDREECRWRL